MSFTIPSVGFPGQLFHQRGSLAQVRRLRGRRAALIVGQASLEMGGHLVKVQGLLQAAGLDNEVLARVTEDPSVTDVTDLGARLSQYAPDWVIAIGGGAVIDSAKAGWISYEHPEINWSRVPNRFPRLRRKARFLALPTTSGSGAEVSPWIVLRNPRSGARETFFTPEVMPDIAIIDSAVSGSQPRSVTASSGFLALTHALESLSSPRRNGFADSFALHALRMVLERLPRAFKQGEDREAREALHVAGTLAGLARSNSTPGLTSAFAHAAGIFGIPHGLAASLFLVPVLQLNMRAGALFDDIARRIGLENKEELLVAIYRLRSRVGLPDTIWDTEVNPDLVQQKSTELIERVVNDVGARGNLCRPSRQDLTAILALTQAQSSHPSREETSVMAPREPVTD